jgi:ferredoxin
MVLRYENERRFQDVVSESSSQSWSKTLSTTTNPNKGLSGENNILAFMGSPAHIFRQLIGKFMADAANKYSENISGKYYVDNQCIDCDLCRETAPDNFKRNEDGGYSYVYKQPESPEEEARCKEAKEGCPVEAIGDNGA